MKIIIKMLCLSLIFLGTNISQAAESLLDPKKGLFDFHHVFTREAVIEAGGLSENMKPNVCFINWVDLKERCQKEVDERTARLSCVPAYDVGLLTVINLTSQALKIHQFSVESDTVAVFARCFDKYGWTEKIPLSQENTAFVHSSKYLDGHGHNLYSICPAALNSYATSNFCSFFIFGECDETFQGSVKRLILEKYQRYAQEPLCLDQRVESEPEIKIYLEDPEGYAESLEAKQILFFRDGVLHKQGFIL